MSRHALFGLVCAWVLCASAVLLGGGGAGGIQEAEASLVGDKTITASRGDQAISLGFSSDGTAVTGYVQFGDTRVELGDKALVRERGDRLFIIDKSSDLKILLKPVSDTKYLVLAKANTGGEQQLRSRLVGAPSLDGAASAQQRDFGAEMREKQRLAESESDKSDAARDSKLSEKEKRLEAELKKFREQLEKEQKKKASPDGPGLTPEEIKKRLEEYKKQNPSGDAAKKESASKADATGSDTAARTESGPTLSKDKKIKIFASVPRHAEWRDEFRYSVLVTDDARHKFDSTFNKFVGNRLAGVTVNGTIRDPSGGILHRFGGVTDLDGTYGGSYVVPDNTPARGEYSFAVNTTKNFDGNTFAVADASEPFFVTAARGNSFNNPPVAKASTSFDTSSNTYTLDGSGSTDQDSTDLTYAWMQLRGTNVTLTPSNMNKITMFSLTHVDKRFVMDNFTLAASDVTHKFQNSTLIFTNVLAIDGNILDSLPAPLVLSSTAGGVASDSGGYDVSGANIMIGSNPAPSGMVVANSTLTISSSTIGIEQPLRFSLVVSDGEKQSSDTVDIVLPP